jgi:hypothetical protein
MFATSKFLYTRSGVDFFKDGVVEGRSVWRRHNANGTSFRDFALEVSSSPQIEGDTEKQLKEAVRMLKENAQAFAMHSKEAPKEGFDFFKAIAESDSPSWSYLHHGKIRDNPGFKGDKSPHGAWTHAEIISASDNTKIIKYPQQIRFNGHPITKVWPKSER